MSGGAWPAQVALLGAGTMGSGFAQIFALAGLPCALADRTPELASAARERLVELAAGYEAAGMFPSGAADRITGLVRAAGSIEEAVEGADYVLEAVFEDAAVKAETYRLIEPLVAADTVIASNPSAIPIGRLAAALERRDRFLGTHWFNPPQWVPCVEVIPTSDTRPDVVERVVALHRRLGKRPVTVGDAPGFVANRLQFALFKEATAIVDEGIASAEEVDEVVRGSFGFRLPFFGPFTIADMAGLDVYAAACAVVAEGLGPRFDVPRSTRELVEAGRFGAKSGSGYLEWPAERREPLIAGRYESYNALQSLLGELRSSGKAS
jgi:3-hydroxybutyryl-CoA dehydrogenase